jgi:hypothetical protein
MHQDKNSPASFMDLGKKSLERGPDWSSMINKLFCCDLF